MHGFGEVSLLEMYEQVIVIGHEAVGQDVCRAGVDEVAADEAEEMKVILTLKEDALAIYASVIEVIMLSGDESKLAARHRAGLRVTQSGFPGVASRHRVFLKNTRCLAIIQFLGIKILVNHNV
jgi:hypothetical protein